MGSSLLEAAQCLPLGGIDYIPWRNRWSERVAALHGHQNPLRPGPQEICFLHTSCMAIIHVAVSVTWGAFFVKVLAITALLFGFYDPHFWKLFCSYGRTAPGTSATPLQRSMRPCSGALWALIHAQRWRMMLVAMFAGEWPPETTSPAQYS